MHWRSNSFFLPLMVLLCTFFISGNALFGSKDRVRLHDVNVLTLKDGHMTTGRRSSPVKQLQCIGGSAGCSAFRPQVVQCYNRGSDGYDVQWECKSDMDNAYRFGKIEVICEGYDHPDDEYILRGSCGLEYTIDLTKEGHQKQNQHHNYYGGSGGGSYNNNYGYSRKSSSSIYDWISLAVVAVIIYGLYKTCIQTPVQTGYADTDDGYGGGQGYWGGGGGGGSPPPPGFRPDYQSGNCGRGSGTRYNQGGGGGGGFWTGAATGGLLGYMFGNNRNRGYGYGGYGRPRTGFGYSSRGYGGGGFGGGGFGGGSFGGGGSTGTRTASGFGGTRRR